MLGVILHQIVFELLFLDGVLAWDLLLRVLVSSLGVFIYSEPCFRTIP